MIYKLFTDGSTRQSGLGGYGFIVVKNEEVIDTFIRREENTTNQRCELLALISACNYIKRNNIQQAILYSDSAYCLNAHYDKWYVNWEKNGWINSKKQPVKNRDLWEQLIPFYKENKIIFEKVSGHSDCYFNNYIDSLVVTISNGKTDDLTNKFFGNLEVISLCGNKFTTGNNTTKWKCLCSCGKTTIVTHGNLVNEMVKSCGCLIKQNHNYIDYSGQIINSIQVMNKTNLKDNGGYIYWQAKCLECGNIFRISSRQLRARKVFSCGCIKSKGEQQIIKILNKLQEEDKSISFQTQYTFDDLKNYNKLKFDFAIFKKEKLICLIEYQGEQHYKSGTGWNTEEHLEKTKFNDNLKKEYCNKNKIKLIEIPYTDYNKINKEYMLEVIK